MVLTEWLGFSLRRFTFKKRDKLVNYSKSVFDKFDNLSYSHNKIFVEVLQDNLGWAFNAETFVDKCPVISFIIYNNKKKISM